MEKCSGSAKKARAYVQRYKESEKHCTDANAYCTKRSFSKLSVGAYINHQNKRARLAVRQALLFCGYFTVWGPSAFCAAELCAVGAFCAASRGGSAHGKYVCVK